MHASAVPVRPTPPPHATSTHSMPRRRLPRVPGFYPVPMRDCRTTLWTDVAQAHFLGWLAETGKLWPAWRQEGEALAQDCVQKALIKVHANLERCQSTVSFREWAAQVLRRVVLDELHSLVTSKRGDLLSLDLARLFALAPQITTSYSAPEGNGVRSAPRLVARTGIRRGATVSRR